MRDRIADLLNKGPGNTSETEFRALILRYEAQCADVARQEVGKQEARDAAAQAPVRQAQDAARCKEVDSQRLEQHALERHGTPLTDAQQRQRSAVEATVAREYPRRKI